MGGDECALCGGSIEDDATVVQTSDGSTATLCASCARSLDQYVPAVPTVDSPDTPATAPPSDQLAINFPEAIHISESLTAFLQQLDPAVEELQGSLIAAEKQIHTLEVEVVRLKERLRHAEELLAQPPSPPSAATLPPPMPEFTSPPPPPPVLQATPEEMAGAFGIEAEIAGAAGVDATETEAATGAIESDRADAWRRAGLTADDARLVQRYFAESEATEKMRAVRRSLGRPAVNLHPLAGNRLRIMVTIAWEIVWYQYLVELTPDLDPDDRILAFAEGMELEELAPHFRVENATLDQGGRVDASELELELLTHPPELITEMPADRAAALDDATEEIWNKRGQPEFRWDD